MRLKRITTLFLIFFGCFFLLKCASTQHISYKVKNTEESSITKFKNKTFNIVPFEDLRKNDTFSQILFSGERKMGDLCINSESHYKNVSEDIAKQFAIHLDGKKIFKTVTSDSNLTSDYYLTGKIKRIYGEQNYSQTQAVGMQFGLIGALATAGVKEPGKISIILTELNIFNKEGDKVGHLYNINKNEFGEYPGDTSCFAIYHRINDEFRKIGEILTKNIEAIFRHIKK